MDCCYDKISHIWSPELILVHFVQYGEQITVLAVGPEIDSSQLFNTKCPKSGLASQIDLRLAQASCLGKISQN